MGESNAMEKNHWYSHGDELPSLIKTVDLCKTAENFFWGGAFRENDRRTMRECVRNFLTSFAQRLFTCKS